MLDQNCSAMKGNTMLLKAVIEEDFSNYKLPAMLLAFPSCTFKCEQECGERVCQNSALAQSPDMDVSPTILVQRYLDNPITKALVCGGLEPFDSYNDLIKLCKQFRLHSQDPIVIYTGYKESEIAYLFPELKKYSPIIIKFGRYVPHQQPHFDDVLGVQLASDNQYAKEI